MTQQIPPLPDLARITQAALFNARDLLADARTLTKAGSWPRAHALAVLALEETGKAGICIQSMPPFGQRTAREFWKAFNSHESKLEVARGVLELLVRESARPVIEMYERLTVVSKSDHVRKMSGLFADYNNGRVATPAEITPTEAETMISDTQLALDFHMRAWGDAQAPARIVERLAEAGPDMAAFMAALDTAMDEDPEAALRRARQFIHEQLRRGQEEPADEPSSTTTIPPITTARQSPARPAGRRLSCPHPDPVS
jgi:AbiV family abortive infection protein